MSEKPPKLDESSEELPRISPEELQEMLEQVPILKEMLQSMRTRLEELESSENPDMELVEITRADIKELEDEIKGREDAGI